LSSIEFYLSERMARASVGPVQKFNLLAGRCGVVWLKPLEPLFVLVGSAMPRFCSNSVLWMALALFVPLSAFYTPFVHASDTTGKATPRGKDLPAADSGRPLPPTEHKGVIPPPPIGDEGIYTDAPNPEAGHEEEVIPPPETPSEEPRHGRDRQRLL